MRLHSSLVARAWIGLGSNLGSREAYLRAAVELLDGTEAVRVVDVSRVYETDPVGPPQPRYFNAACAIDTTIEPEALLGVLQAIEGELGRVRSANRWGPRTIDLDLLAYDERVILADGLVVPHPSLHERDFALAPLVDLAPQARHAALKTPLADLLAGVGGPPRTSWVWSRRAPLEVERIDDPRGVGYRTNGRDWADLCAACVVCAFAAGPPDSADAPDAANARPERVLPVAASGQNRTETLTALLDQAHALGLAVRLAVVREASDTKIEGTVRGRPLHPSGFARRRPHAVRLGPSEHEESGTPRAVAWVEFR